MEIRDLLSKPVWQMTGEEFIFLNRHALQGSETKPAQPAADKGKKIGGIARLFGCSIPTANRIKKSGRINRAITQIGRKIIVDSYGGKGAHGGGAFSGKDPSKGDRSAAYAARHMAKNMVAAGIADEVLIQVSYAIGVAQPVSLFVDTNHTSHVAMSDAEIADKIGEIFDLRPKAIEERLKLRNPIYEETAAYGHMGRQPRTVHKTFTSRYEKPVEVDVELFTWEKLDYVDTLKKAFSL